MKQKWLKFRYMIFLQIINKKKITLISIFLLLYIILNLFDGERGLISYYEKQRLKDQLIQEKNFLIKELALVEKKNNLLTVPAGDNVIRLAPPLIINKKPVTLRGDQRPSNSRQLPDQRNQHLRC